jgi:cytochrome b561
MLQLKNTASRFGFVASLLHWIIAAAIIYLLYRGFFGLHKAIGITILMLAVLRIVWRQMNVQPAVLASASWRIWAAKSAHFLLYVLMLAIPLSGWLMSSAAGKPISFYGWFEVPPLITPDTTAKQFFASSHYWLTRAMIGLIGVHVLAVLYHYVILRDRTLKRMITWCRD